MQFLIIYDGYDEGCRLAAKVLNEIGFAQLSGAPNISGLTLTITSDNPWDEAISDIFTPYNKVHNVIIIIGDIIPKEVIPKIERSSLNIIRLGYDFTKVYNLHAISRLLNPFIQVLDMLNEFYHMHRKPVYESISIDSNGYKFNSFLDKPTREIICDGLTEYFVDELKGLKTPNLEDQNPFMFFDCVKSLTNAELLNISGEVARYIKETFYSNENMKEMFLTNTDIYDQNAMVFIVDSKEIYSPVSSMLTYLSSDCLYFIFIYLNQKDGSTEVALYPNYSKITGKYNEENIFKFMDIFLRNVCKILKINGLEDARLNTEMERGYPNLHPRITVPASLSNQFKRSFANAFINRLIGKDMTIVRGDYHEESI